MSLQEKSFKELNIMLETIAEHFFAARKMTLINNKDQRYQECELYSLYLLKVEKAYSSLNEKEKNLINNEFFYQNYHYWWSGLYSKTNFYRLKRKAMIKFLEVFYHV